MGFVWFILGVFVGAAIVGVTMAMQGFFLPRSRPLFDPDWDNESDEGLSEMLRQHNDQLNEVKSQRHPASAQPRPFRQF